MNNFNSMAGGVNSAYPKTTSPSYFNSTYGAAAPTNNIIWVQGIEGAKAWQLSPNSMAILLDSEMEGKMYIKVSDNIGMSSLRIFNYVEELNIPSTNNATVNNDVDLSNYVTKDELAALIKEAIEKYEQSVSTVAGTGNSSSTNTKPEPAKAKSVTILSK